MEIRKLQEQYLVFCKYRKELDDKTLKAYRIDLRQYFAVSYTHLTLPTNREV